ncbi:hypothetical protein HanXRQr2_Chr09g0410151 [Helianthus annuus]|uniref:Uncharacterized protein n=1 Tax=Helianthus annuus TaxID=4232 RepID=A0A9K3I9J8_HELAN|nr:hypothetical protein HanXRQr2_Chr09g0410151 [Helianthus annuus]
MCLFRPLSITKIKFVCLCDFDAINLKEVLVVNQIKQRRTTKYVGGIDYH